MKRLGLAGTVVIACAALAVALDWTFWSRFLAIRDQTPASYPGWISPTATVAGNFTTALPVVDPVNSTLSQDAINALVAAAEDVDSFSLIVHHRGAIQFETYWHGRGPDDVSETYSMTKSVTGLMFGFAVADGLIDSIDDPVTKYVPEWVGTDRESMTIRHVLTMASGLEHYPFDYQPWQNPYSKQLRLFIGPDMESALLRFGVTAEPGSIFNYNSANSQLLMLIMTRVIARPYADYVSQKLWQPLGAKDATLWLDHDGGMAKAYSFFQARPRDWLRIGLAIKSNGLVGGEQILPADWLAQMTSPSATNPKYGFQTWLGSPYEPTRKYNYNTAYGVPQAEPFPVDDVVFFDGGGGQRVYVIPSADLVIVRTGMPSAKWDDGVLPNIVLKDLGYGTDG